MLRLSGGGSREGTISLSRLASIADTTQKAVTKLARSLTDRAGPGRSPLALEQTTQLVLVAIGPGSTVLQLERETAQTTLQLPGVDLDLGLQAIETFLQGVAAAAGEGALPAAFSAPAVESTRLWFEALSDYDEVRLDAQGVPGGSIRFRPAAAAQSPALIGPAAAPGAGMGTDRAVEGVLYAVNLHTLVFRIEDDLGRSIPCHLSADVDTPGRFLGLRVRAAGPATLDDSGRIENLEIKSLDLASDAPGLERERFFGSRTAADLVAEAAPLESMADLAIDGLTQEEAESFTQAVAGL